MRPWTVHLSLACVAASWAVNQVVTKLVLAAGLPPLPFLFVRFVGLLCLGLLLLGRPGGVRWTRGELGLAAVAGFAGYTVNQLCFIFGLAQTTIFSSALLLCMSPLWTLLGLAVLRLEPVLARQWAGVCLAFAGIVLFVSDGARLGMARGDLISLLGGAAFVALSICNKPLLARHSPDQVLAVDLVWGSVPLLAFGLGPALHQSWAAVTWTTWALIAYTVAVPIFLAYIVWNWGIRTVGVGHTAPYAYLTPILAGAASAVVFGESYGWLKLFGAAACLGGLVLAAGRAPAEAAAD